MDWQIEKEENSAVQTKRRPFYRDRITSKLSLPGKTGIHGG
jgi:hypothetical protein